MARDADQIYLTSQAEIWRTKRIGGSRKKMKAREGEERGDGGRSLSLLSILHARFGRPNPGFHFRSNLRPSHSESQSIYFPDRESGPGPRSHGRAWAIEQGHVLFQGLAARLGLVQTPTLQVALWAFLFPPRSTQNGTWTKY